MIAGIGTDLVGVERIKALRERYGIRFARKILAESELEEYQAVVNKDDYLAKRFAAKEATVKALGTGFRGGIGKHDVWVTHDEMGKPGIQLIGEAKKRYSQLGASRIWITLSDDSGFAMATVILET